MSLLVVNVWSARARTRETPSVLQQNSQMFALGWRSFSRWDGTETQLCAWCILDCNTNATVLTRRSRISVVSARRTVKYFETDCINVKTGRHFEESQSASVVKCASRATAAEFARVAVRSPAVFISGAAADSGSTAVISPLVGRRLRPRTSTGGNSLPTMSKQEYDPAACFTALQCREWLLCTFFVVFIVQCQVCCFDKHIYRLRRFRHFTKI